MLKWNDPSIGQAGTYPPSKGNMLLGPHSSRQAQGILSWYVTLNEQIQAAEYAG